MDKPTAKTAILLGATGLVGQELLKMLLSSEDYGEVLAIVRRRLPEREKLKQLVVDDWDALEEHAEWFEGATDVFCCLGTTMKKAGTQVNFRKVDYDYPFMSARLAKATGAERFIIITAMGANAGSRVFYNRVKGELEAAIRELRLPSVAILRPSLLLGKRDEFRFGEQAAAWLSKLMPFKAALMKYKPIPASTVAAVMLRVAQMYLPGTHVFDNEQLHRMGEKHDESKLPGTDAG
ncbi:oxidoreductase [Xylanibacillus composti]|uniref:Oxidoreductase n=1 Tax=Xylanibacillus composti TaxID=1572762 RepID=A0A8J4M4G1_9BACL|nr:oxidoreductase [Xylanibacillus composti]MDT9725311.1 oxidoreductase [Xylanibacillus composti]GIQ71182.1 oxidoreductase [Xylanibacillus composti]